MANMKNVKGRMDERILVCVYYGPNGERLIRRGQKLAQIMGCPIYVLTVDPHPYDDFDVERAKYVEHWRELCDQLGVDQFIIRDNEKRPVAKVIAEVAHRYNITQIVIGQPPKSRWEEITKGSIVNALLNALTFVDIHIVSVDRTLKSSDEMMEYENGVRAYLKRDGESYRISFARSKDNLFEGIFYNEIGTDFNNGAFKFVHKEGNPCQLPITADLVVGTLSEEPNIKIPKH